jgi:hypothetical protein
MKKLLVFVMVLALLGCDKQAEEPKEPAAPPPPKVEKLGKALAGAEEVAIADLFKDPAAFEGKVVGVVQDFCHHRRAWFGVTAKDGERMLRVFAAPRFQVPADCKGKTATAEGKVELITLKPEDAQHYAKEHKFLTKEEIDSGKPIQRPLIRAFGAEFR